MLQFHPDANQQNSQAHSQFIKINEAYSVLSKPTSRREYDFLLENEAVVSRNKSWEAYKTAEERPWRDETIWHMRDRSQDGNYQSKPYYGIHGIKKLSNTWIVVACLVFTALGVGLQFLAIRSSFTMSRDLLEKRSQEIGKTHQTVRQQAEMNGNSRQIQLLKQRLQPVSAD
ncbi:hypothetical protein B566_EDAN001874 [Ephemera danica]|nr:hypothetical protein B566_EDAN001874 [Ephemera danica]